MTQAKSLDRLRSGIVAHFLRIGAGTRMAGHNPTLLRLGFWDLS
jgi:hypothetical protein